MEKELLEKEKQQLAEENARLYEVIASYRKFAEIVRSATIFDVSIYDEVSPSEWISIDRDDYDDIMDALSELDVWRPWNSEIQRRIISR